MPDAEPYRAWANLEFIGDECSAGCASTWWTGRRPRTGATPLFDATQDDDVGVTVADDVGSGISGSRSEGSWAR